jgi:hypothetical protein
LLSLSKVVGDKGDDIVAVIDICCDRLSIAIDGPILPFERLRLHRWLLVGDPAISREPTVGPIRMGTANVQVQSSDGQMSPDSPTLHV